LFVNVILVSLFTGVQRYEKFHYYKYICNFFWPFFAHCPPFGPYSAYFGLFCLFFFLIVLIKLFVRLIIFTAFWAILLIRCVLQKNVSILTEDYSNMLIFAV